MLRRLVRWLLCFAMSGRKSRLIVQNPDDRRAVVDAGLMDASQVRLIAGSGVDTQRYQPRSDALCASGRTASIVFAAAALGQGRGGVRAGGTGVACRRAQHPICRGW